MTENNRPISRPLTEKDGNFYFVRAYNMRLYKYLLDAENNAVLNLRAAGGRLRAALEYFRDLAMPRHLIQEVFAANAARNSPDAPKRKNTVDYETIFRKHPELRVSADQFGVVRQVSNELSHTEKRKFPKYRRTYKDLCKGLRNMQQLLYYYYTGKTNCTYRKECQPIDGYWLHSVLETADATPCECQLLYSRPDPDIKDLMHYRLLRQYRAVDSSEGAFRDETALNLVWNGQLKDPQNIVRAFTLHVEYDGEEREKEEKRFIYYAFDAYLPHPLSKIDISALSQAQKIMLLHDMANGVRELHRHKVYHRNLHPGCVYVFFERDSEYVQAKLVGFECAKIVGKPTVYKSVQAMHNDINFLAANYFSLSMQFALQNATVQNAERMLWDKEDIYSLGALFHLLLTGRPPLAGKLSPQVTKAAGAISPDLADLIPRMLDPISANRPGIDEIRKVLAGPYMPYAEE